MRQSNLAPAVNDERGWWQKPFRMVQTNLRMTDASLDPRKLAQETLELGCDVLLFNIGGMYAFYPTELELQARNWMLQGDLLGEMVTAAHEAGLKIVGRFDMSKATQIAYDKHPDWFVHNRAGEPLVYNGTYQACVNGGWYTDYAPRIIEEALSRYPVDGVFFNMFGYRSTDYSGRYHGICVCENCQRRFEEMYGRQLPQAENFTDPAYRDYLAFTDRTSLELADRIYHKIKSVRPDVAVMGQRTTNDLIRMEIQRAVDRPAPEWPHQAGEQARWAAALGKGKVFSSTSTNFIDFAWRFVAETAACHQLRFAQQIANGAALDYYLLGVIEQDDKKPMAAIRDLFNWHRQHEADYDGVRSAARVGLYHSRKNAIFGPAVSSAKYIQPAFRGMYRMLLEARIPFDFVIDEQAADSDFAATLARYDTIVLPNIACLAEDEAAALDKFVEAGGTLIVTGETGLYDETGQARSEPALHSLPTSGLDQFHPDMRGAYFTMEETENAHAPDATLMYLDGPYWALSERPGVQRQMTLLPPQRFGPPELCFPETQSDLPGVLLRQFGKGVTIQLPWLPDWLYQRDSLPDFRALFARLLHANAPPQPVRLEGRGRVELTVAQHPDGGLLVHVVNYTGQNNNLYEDAVDLHGLRLGVLDKTLKSANALVGEIGLALSAPDAEGYRWLDLPPVGAFQAVRII